MGHFVNDPTAPDGRRWVEDGEGVETVQSGPVFNWEGQQYNIPDTAPLPPNSPSTFGQGFREGFEGTFGTPDNWRQSFGRMFGFGGENSGSGIGSSVGRNYAQSHGPQLNLGEGILPEDQAYIDALSGLQSTIGAAPTITAPQLPPVPEAMFEVDPGLNRLVEHAENRQSQIERLISSMRGEREGEVAHATSRWATLGRWLGQVASVDDLSQGGVIMERVLRDNQDMRDELRRETLEYIQMGMSAEDAVVQAQVALLSGQAAARREMAAAQYGRDTQQTGLDFQASVANTEAAARGANARTQSSIAILEAQREASARAREGRTTAAQVLTGDPRYAQQAFGALAGNITGDEATQQALSNVMSDQQLNGALMGYVAQYAGARQIPQSVRRLLQEWDPRITENDIRNSTPQQLMLRLTQDRARSAQAFARNREFLLRSQQFGGMTAPAQ